MATLTRTQLRRALGVRTGQPYFRRFGNGAGEASANGTTTTLIDTVRLKEEDNYWRGSFIYFPDTDEIREISGFTNSTSTVTWLAPIGTADTVADGEPYEIWSQFTPDQIHDAINHALLQAWPNLFMTGNNEDLALVDGGGLRYTLPTTDEIRRLCSVYLTLYQSRATGSITTEGTTTQIIDSGASFVAADVGRFIAVYKDGATANGEIREISVRDSATQVTVSAAFSEAVPEGAKYRILDKEDTTPQILPITNAIADKVEFPTELWFGSHPAGFEGYPLYLVYEFEYPKLTTEAGTTTCPEEYIYAMAMAYIYMLKMATAPSVEVPTWEAMFKAAAAMGEVYVRTHRMAHLPVMRIDHQSYMSSVPSDYPFR